MKTKKDSLNVVAFFNILGPVILNGINFITIPIFTRLLGTDNYGMYTIYYTWVNTFAIVIGLQALGSVGVANIRFSKDELKSYYSSTICLTLVTFVVCLLLALAGLEQWVRFLGMPGEMVILMLVHALGMSCVGLATTRYTFEKKAYYTFGISVSIAVVSVVLSLLLLKRNHVQDMLYCSRAYGAAIPYIVLCGVFIVFYLFEGKVLYSKKYWKFCIQLGLPLVFHGLSQIILGQADKVMIQNLMDESSVGIYSFVYTFAHIMNIIYVAFNNTWVPFYYDDVKSNNIESIHKKTKNYVFLFSMLSVGFMLLAPDVIKLFAGRDFWTGIPMIPIFVLSNYMVFLYSFPVNYEFYHKKTSHIALGTCGAAFINFILNYIFIPMMGMSGAAYATLISYVLLWIFHHYISKCIIKENYHYRIKQFLPGICMVTGTAFLVVIIQDYILWRWGLAIVAGIILLRHFIKEKSIF